MKNWKERGYNNEKTTGKMMARILAAVLALMVLGMGLAFAESTENAQVAENAEGAENTGNAQVAENAEGAENTGNAQWDFEADVVVRKTRGGEARPFKNYLLNPPVV